MTSAASPNPFGSTSDDLTAFPEVVSRDLMRPLNPLPEDYGADEDAPLLTDEQIDALYPPDQTGRGGPSSALQGQVQSCAGSAEMRHNPNDPADVAARLRELLAEPEVRELNARLDAEPSESPTGYRYPPSQKMGFLWVSLLINDHTLKGVHRYVQSQPEVREVLGFAPMAPEVQRANVLRGRSHVIREPHFPTRQTLAKYIDTWMRSRADWLIPYLQQLVANVAFRTVIDFDLNPYRIVLDTAPMASGLKQQGKKRRDPGARRFQHNRGQKGSTFGRKVASATFGDSGLFLYGRALIGVDDALIADHVLLPVLKGLAEDFRAYAAARGIDHPGINTERHRAGLFGDSHFNTIAVHNRAYRYGFEPGFASRESGRPAKMLDGKRRLRVVKGTEWDADVRWAELEMDSRGRYYCPCEADKPFKQRRPMEQTANRFGKDFRLRCTRPRCHRTGTEYWTNRRGGLVQGASGRWVRPEVDTLIRTLAHGDRRAVAVAHYSRQLHERNHSLLGHMGLLGKARGPHRKHLTGKFRHDLWVTLGLLNHNLTINANFAAERVSLEKLDWDDLYIQGVRNGASAVAKKDLANESDRRYREKLTRPRPKSSARTARLRQQQRNARPPNLQAA